MSLGFPRLARAGAAAGLAVTCLALNAASTSAATEQRAQPGMVAAGAARDPGVAQHPRGRRDRRRPRHGGLPEPGRPPRGGDDGPRLHPFRPRARRGVLGYPRHRHRQPHRRPRPRRQRGRRHHGRRAGRQHPVGAGDAGKQRPAADGRQRRGRAAGRHRPRDQVRRQPSRDGHRPAAGPGHGPGFARRGRQQRREGGGRLRPGPSRRAGRARRGRGRRCRPGELPGLL